MNQVEHVSGTWSDTAPKNQAPNTPHRRRPSKTATEVRQDFDGVLTVPLRRGNSRSRRYRRRHGRPLKE